ncbi:MAG: energy transducer TonB [Pseudomonadota bacterium]
MLYFRSLTVACLALVVTLTAKADLETLGTEFNNQIAANDIEAAHRVGLDYYAASTSEDDHETAGRVAYTMASLAALREDKEAVPDWFDRCADHYGALGAAAQEVDCIHKAALSYKSLNKPGTTRHRLKSAERALKAANAEHTIVAALIYADLAESYIPPQFEVGASANADRERVLDYTHSARTILSDNGQEGHFLYATLLAREATALEDLERFEEAMPPLQQAIEMMADQPDQAELVADLRRRYAKISAWSGDQDGDPNLITVKMEDGREVQLKITRRSRVIYPKTQNMASEYGIGTVLISLDSKGDVAEIEIINSEPTPEFGAAVEKAVKRWRFSPQDDTPPESIPAFSYGISFDIVRRR